MKNLSSALLWLASAWRSVSDAHAIYGLGPAAGDSMMHVARGAPERANLSHAHTPHKQIAHAPCPSSITRVPCHRNTPLLAANGGAAAASQQPPPACSRQPAAATAYERAQPPESDHPNIRSRPLPGMPPASPLHDSAPSPPHLAESSRSHTLSLSPLLSFTHSLTTCSLTATCHADLAGTGRKLPAHPSSAQPSPAAC